MAAAITREDVETRAHNLEVAFSTLASDAKNVERELRDVNDLRPTDFRVVPWILQLRERLNASRRWINDVHRQTTRHNFNGQERHFENIQRVVQEADDLLYTFSTHFEPRQYSLRLLYDLFECAEDLTRDFGSWASRERHNPMTNPPQLGATRHAAEMPPAPRGNEDEDVNPGESLARTGNPYIITQARC